MAEVAFSNAAETDLVEIDEFSAEQFGEDVAEAYMHGFDEAFALLRDHPKAGAACPELGNGIRCLVHRRHRIFYTFEDELVLIVRIVHHAMNASVAMKGWAG